MIKGMNGEHFEHPKRIQSLHLYSNLKVRLRLSMQNILGMLGMLGMLRMPGMLGLLSNLASISQLEENSQNVAF